MTKLPEWIEKHWDSYDHEICGGECPLREALAITWEALNIGETSLPLGDPIGRVLRDAVRRISALGNAVEELGK